MSTVDPLASLGSITAASGLPAVDPSQEPANIRDGGTKAQQAYQTGLAFEQVLLNQLAQQLTSSADLSGSDDGSDGSGDDSGDGSSSTGLLGSGPASSEISQLLPGALTSSVMSGGGVGNLADSIAAAIDPAINDPAHS